MASVGILLLLVWFYMTAWRLLRRLEVSHTDAWIRLGSPVLPNIIWGFTAPMRLLAYCFTAASTHTGDSRLTALIWSYRLASIAGIGVLIAFLAAGMPRA